MHRGPAAKFCRNLQGSEINTSLALGFERVPIFSGKSFPSPRADTNFWGPSGARVMNDVVFVIYLRFLICQIAASFEAPEDWKYVLEAVASLAFRMVQFSWSQPALSRFFTFLRSAACKHLGLETVWAC